MASGQSDATLATLRARIRTQIENASGLPEPLAVTVSTETLTTLTDRVETLLQDSGNVKWAATDVNEALEQALEQWSRRKPQHKIGTVTLSSDGREINISSLTGLLRVEKVWWDYDSSTPGHPPNWRQFEVWAGSILYIDDPTEPSNGDKVRIWYTLAHTINGLNSAAATTLPNDVPVYLIAGSAGIAAQMRAVELSESLNVDRDVVDRLQDWAKLQTKQFRYGMNLRDPAWKRYASAYDQRDIDEALRWALHRLTEILPDRTITTVTLSSTGREIDISSITDYIEIERVWWNYDSSDPGHPPKWRNFELWPGNLLYVKDPSEPASGDIVRIWYTRTQSLNGLDGASTTTIPRDTETLLVTGASGYTTQQRVQEAVGYRVPVKLREWAEARIREFERGLKALARREAARHSGIAPGPVLDRWDAQGGGWF
jgi:hypothetical protein